MEGQPDGNARILALAVSSKEELDMMVDRVRSEHGLEIHYPLLSDPGHRVIDRYGLLNPEGRGWPHPTVFIIDRTGTVRWRFVEVDYRVRATNDAILEELSRLRR